MSSYCQNNTKFDKNLKEYHICIDLTYKVAFFVQFSENICSFLLPYSLDFIPRDFYVFQYLKSYLVVPQRLNKSLSCDLHHKKYLFKMKVHNNLCLAMTSASTMAEIMLKNNKR